MRKPLLVLVLAAALGAMWAAAQQVNSNPVETTPIDRGRVLYEQHCASCHGKDGKGDGPVASTMSTSPTDLTLMRRRYGAFLDAQLESAIRGTAPVVAHGVPEMMVWGAIFRADARGNRALIDARIHELIAYVETMQDK